jgi:hypothetical protein
VNPETSSSRFLVETAPGALDYLEKVSGRSERHAEPF